MGEERQGPVWERKSGTVRRNADGIELVLKASPGDNGDACSYIYSAAFRQGIEEQQLPSITFGRRAISELVFLLSSSSSP